MRLLFYCINILEYNNSDWAPYKRCDIEELEKCKNEQQKLVPWGTDGRLPLSGVFRSLIVV